MNFLIQCDDVCLIDCSEVEYVVVIFEILNDVIVNLIVLYDY